MAANKIDLLPDNIMSENEVKIDIVPPLIKLFTYGNSMDGVIPI